MERIRRGAEFSSYPCINYNGSMDRGVSKNHLFDDDCAETTNAKSSSRQAGIIPIVGKREIVAGTCLGDLTDK